MKLISWIYLLLLLSTPLLAEGYTVIKDLAEMKIETPELRDQEMRKLRLANGLEVLLISDPHTHQSGAALAVAVGSWDDPEDRPGMAHFVEHMLFLGTAKYPEEEGYTRFLDEHGGQRNAFTMTDRTVYMFSANNVGFLEALDRFGQFFISPLFSPSGVDRECKAIHQEFCKNIPLDPWRIHYVKKELANDNHPFHRFCIGNQDTLAHISQDELKEWYRCHYSARGMHLVVFSSLAIDTLEKEIVSIFSQVPDKECCSNKSKEPLFNSKCIGQMLTIAPIHDVQSLELTWELPRELSLDLISHSDKLLSFVFGHEGSTSLLAQLKRENLAESISAGASRAGKDQACLTLSIDLTSKGLINYETVIQRCFEAIASIRESGIPLFLFDELQRKNELAYRFQSREEVFRLVTEYATAMVDEPLETFPRQSLIATRHAPETINSLLYMLSADTCQFTLVAPSALVAKCVPLVGAWTQEKWMGVPYCVHPIASEKLSLWSKALPHPQISIPRPNAFIPENVQLALVVDSASKNTLPQVKEIVDSPKGKFFLATDDRYGVPEIEWSFLIKTPLISDKSAKSHALADIFCLAVKEELNTVSYEASIGDLHYTLATEHNGLRLKINGFSFKAQGLLQTILSTLHSLKPTAAHFQLYQELLLREYQNSANDSPFKQAAAKLSSILYKEYASLEDKITALQKLRLQDVARFSADLFKEYYIQGTLFGNLSEHEGQEVCALFEKEFSGKPYYKENQEKIALAAFKPTLKPSYVAFPTTQPANALILAIDAGDFSFKKRAAQEILSKGLEEPFFSELRTKQQTAYLVTNWSQELERHLYNFFGIQSSSHDTRDLLARFELFIESTLQELSTAVIPKERFEAIRLSSIEKLSHPADNLAKMGALLNTLAFDYDADFTWLDQRIAAFKNLSYEEFLNYAQEILGKKNTKRIAICIDGKLPSQEHLIYYPLSSRDAVRRLINYQIR